MRVGRRGRFVGLEMTRFHQPLRAVARFACIAALLCCCGFVPREKHAGQTQANELEGVYVVGTLYKRGHNVVVVWENGVPKQLTDKKGYALAEAVSVCGGDVYVVGNVYDADRRHSKATVWKNGVPQVLETGEAASSRATAMVVSNGDVYVVGTVLQTRFKPRAALWKNGVLTWLTDENTPAEAKAVAVRMPMYMWPVWCTEIRRWPHSGRTACRQSLPDGEDGSVDAIAVSDGTVYVTGIGFPGRNRHFGDVVVQRHAD